MLELTVFASKLLLYAVALGGAGASLHQAIGIPSSRRLFASMAIILVIAVALRFIVLNAQMGGSLSAAFSVEQVSWTWMGVGNQTIAFLAGAALLFVSAFASSPIISIAASMIIASAFGLAGHSAGLDAPGIAPYVVMGHALIAAFWLAAPWTLWPQTEATDAVTLDRTRKFSRFAIFVIPLLFVSGLWLLWRLGGGVEGVIGSLYGRLLLGKFAIALAILGLGALNKTFVTGKLATSPADGRKALRATLRIDAILFLAVLTLIASATTFTGPNE